jgi:hypothetical protein
LDKEAKQQQEEESSAPIARPKGKSTQSQWRSPDLNDEEGRDFVDRLSWHVGDSLKLLEESVETAPDLSYDAIVTDPPWNRLAKTRSRLVPTRVVAASAQPVLGDGAKRLPDTDHISPTDIQKHTDLWYKLLNDDGMVMIRLDWDSRELWVAALVKSKFNVMQPSPHGVQESPDPVQVPIVSFLSCISSVCLLLRYADTGMVGGAASTPISGSSRAKPRSQRSTGKGTPQLLTVPGFLAEAITTTTSPPS